MSTQKEGVLLIMLSSRNTCTYLGTVPLQRKHHPDTILFHPRALIKTPLLGTKRNYVPEEKKGIRTTLSVFSQGLELSPTALRHIWLRARTQCLTRRRFPPSRYHDQISASHSWGAKNPTRKLNQEEKKRQRFSSCRFGYRESNPLAGEAISSELGWSAKDYQKVHIP